MELNDKRLKLTSKRIEAMHSLGLNTSEDLLSYYPFRYEELNASSFSTWKEKEKVCFEGTICSRINSIRLRGNRTISKFDVLTEEQVVHVTIYNQPWVSNLHYDSTVTILGVYQGKANVVANKYIAKSLAEQDKIIPVYSTKEGIQQKTIRACISNALNALTGQIEDLIPIEFIRSYRLLPKETALQKIHNPKTHEDVTASVRTLKYEEFLRFFLTSELLKSDSALSAYKKPKEIDQNRVEQLIDTLPYSLTEDQLSSLQDVMKDMQSPRQMYRLLQGDVGCGKTAVATLSMYACVTSGYQAALLAPTEILAQQHFESISRMLETTNTKIAVLYSGQKQHVKNQIEEQTKNGEIDILIGTHSILQDNIQFKNLGLVVADEQQRFGVQQRKTLREKGDKVDFLLMSATPIPRTLASTMFGDMEISTISTMPVGRKQVHTELILENSFRTCINDIYALLEEGRQLYVICAAVEFNEDYDARNVHDVTEALNTLFKGQYKVGTLHGRMSSEEKQDIMEAFDRNDIQILVSTTVVEVGMNVVNATGMIIYNAERFGLSQLHQLRGRVQRGSSQGYCWLLTGNKDPDVRQRLQVLVDTTDGFKIAEEDLRMRGPGDILGTRQSGLPDFVLGNLIEDSKIMEQARKDAKKMILDQDNPDYVKLIDDVSEKQVAKASYWD